MFSVLTQSRLTPGPLARLEERERAHILLEAITFLPAPHRLAMTLRFGLDGEGPRRLVEVGERMALSKERIRQLEAEALQLLAAMLEDVL